MAKKIGKLRKQGINTALMAPSAGSQSVPYGYDITGVACSALVQARRTVGRAAAPRACGKNVDLAWYAVDGSCGTGDPGFEAHVLPIIHWATAWSEQWLPPDMLASSFSAALEAVGKDATLKWNKAVGPTVAALMGCHPPVRAHRRPWADLRRAP